MSAPLTCCFCAGPVRRAPVRVEWAGEPICDDCYGSRYPAGLALVDQLRTAVRQTRQRERTR